MQMNQTMTTKGAYECPAGEERLWHVQLCPKAKFDPETGERKAKPTVHKFGRKAFRRLSPIWLTQGYEMEILHNPDKWEEEQAAKAQAQKAAGKKEQTVKK